MRILKLLPVTLTLLLLTGCASNLSMPAPVASVRSYSGTASVGDFLTITLDPATQTITYTDVYGQEGIVPYTVTYDGTYALTT